MYRTIYKYFLSKIKKPQLKYNILVFNLWDPYYVLNLNVPYGSTIYEYIYFEF